MICFTVLGEPASKSNSRRLVSFRNRPAMIKSEKALRYEMDFDRQLPQCARQMLQGNVRVTLRVFYSSERPDLDESVILDCMQARYKRFKGPLEAANSDRTEFRYGKGERKLISRGVYLNDRQVREKHVFHAIDKNNPRTEIEVELIHAELFQQAAA